MLNPEKMIVSVKSWTRLDIGLYLSHTGKYYVITECNSGDYTFVNDRQELN